MNRRSLLTIIVVGWAAAIASGSVWAQTRELGSAGELLDGIAAVVDEGIVLKSELAQRLTAVINNLRAQQLQLPPEQRSQLPPVTVLERQILDQLVIKEIQLQRANRLGITVGDDILNQALAAVGESLGLTLEQLPEALAAENLDYTMYREDSRQDLLIEQLERRDVLARITVTPRELQQCLVRAEETQANEFDYNISHILVGVSASASSEDVETAEQLIGEIHSIFETGGDFAEMALSYSDGQTALQGGSLGWRKGSELPTFFADVVIDMQPEEFSEPIRSGSGFNLVRLNEMRGAERVVVDQIHVRHILISTNEVLDNDAARQRMLGIREQIINGDDFSAVAQSVSEDSGSANDGGDLGWTEPDAYVPEFTEELALLELDEISQPFRTRFGWHLAELLGKRTYDSTDEVKEQQCAEEVRASKAQEEREMWLQRLRDQAYVEVKL